MIHCLILYRVRVDSIKRSWWQILLTIIALISLCFRCMLSKSLAPFWKAGCVTKSTSCDLSQLVADPSAQSPGLRTTISQERSCLPDWHGEDVVSREQQTQRAERAKNLELNWAVWSAPAESQPAWTERSLSAADTTQVCSLSPPHTLHVTVFHQF